MRYYYLKNFYYQPNAVRCYEHLSNHYDFSLVRENLFKAIIQWKNICAFVWPEISHFI